MKMNRSLGISTKLQTQLKNNQLGMLNTVYPTEFTFKNSGKSRERVFTDENTLQTMVVTATMEDKSLKNSVHLHYISHQKEREIKERHLQEQIKFKKEKAKIASPTAGRPNLYKEQIPLSTQTDHSLNTAAYSKARSRLPMELIEELFEKSKIVDVQNTYSHWHNYRVYLVDGTYVQIQDTEELRRDYAVKHKGKESEGYPQGLLETISERGSGQIHSYVLSDRHTSELELFYGMIDKIPEESLLLLDDLYNTYEIFSKFESLNIKCVVPGKRVRKYSVIKKITDGDEIVKIKRRSSRPAWLPSDAITLPKELYLRRIETISPEDKTYVLYTSILDEKISKEEIVNLYLTRWDIEISIREIKTIMDINILRSKSSLMIQKELAVSLSAYNLIRKLIYEGIKDMPFSPQDDFFYEWYTLNKDIHIDKKGRVYSKWSTGRKRVQ
ncbi:MAG: IS4 family transposase [Candidatus Marinimicrobia bacterium]|nr:IS4 family transposase [Candidatus Neomarinimicrobiota bacterium]